MSLHYIFMGDIISSSRYDSVNLREDFIEVVSLCNKKLRKNILSPYTITLGDEFQGVAASLEAVVNSIFYMEETIVRNKHNFRIRYVMVHGDIDTPVNRKKAYTMMGSGLTRARNLLTSKGRGINRFRFELEDKYKMNQLNRLFLVLDGIMSRWKINDGSIISDMISNLSNEEVGKLHDKNRTQIWKRRNNLLIEEYRALKDALIDLSNLK